jgi:glyoxylase-like metal-dependent hydrolase (beta-lactamase superfamily II)
VAYDRFVQMCEIASGLWRWTVPHPEWTPREEWPQEVGCVAYAAATGLVVFDPLVPRESAESLWSRLDAWVERSGRAPDVLISLFWHARSAQAILDRYAGTRVWAHEPARHLVAERTAWTNVFRVGDPLPGGIEAIDARRAFEVLFWLPDQRTLIAGDVLHGTQDGRIRLLPDSWLGGADRAAFHAGLRSMLDLPIERILPAHGEPVLTNGREALSHAIAERDVQP